MKTNLESQHEGKMKNEKVFFQEVFYGGCSFT